jgi:hypothetical protein
MRAQAQRGKDFRYSFLNLQEAERRKQQREILYS